MEIVLNQAVNMIFGSTNTHGNVAEFADYTSHISMDFRQVYRRKKGFTVFYRKDYMEVYFSVRVSQFSVAVNERESRAVVDS